MTSSPSSTSARMEKDDWLTTGNNDHFVRRNVQAARVAYVLRNDFAQLHQTGRWPVMREALMQSVTTRVDDVARRIKIGFADLEVNDVAPLRLQRFRFHKHLERSLGAEPRHALGETEFVRLDHHAKSTFTLRWRNLSFENLYFPRAKSCDA